LEKKLVTVVVPTHLPEPTALGKISLLQTLEVLGKHVITFVVPVGLDTHWYESFCRGKAEIRFERFEWQGHREFSRMMLSPAFYERFLAYEYMLICHLDAFVFRDDLEAWCERGYDYIGSVIYDKGWESGLPVSSRKKLVNGVLRKVAGIQRTEYFANGGFALKRIAAFHRLTRRFHRYVQFYRTLARVRGRGFLEDIFVIRHLPRLSRSFKLAPRAEAARFGAEYVNYDESKLPFAARAQESMPFGIHGWIQFQPDYWKPVIRRFGHLI
jgi:hypothetical protein